MTKNMLIDAIHPEETRVVVTDHNQIQEFDFESQSKVPLRGNIYLAKITRVEPSLQAAFVGSTKHQQALTAARRAAEAELLAQASTVTAGVLNTARGSLPPARTSASLWPRACCTRLAPSSVHSQEACGPRQNGRRPRASGQSRTSIA